MKAIDRVFFGLMVLAAMGHLLGTFKYTEVGSGLFVWSLSGVLAALLLAALNFLRQSRPGDKPVAATALAGNLAWVGIVVLFGLSIRNLADPRVLMHGITALVLAAFSVRSLRA